MLINIKHIKYNLNIILSVGLFEFISFFWKSRKQKIIIQCDCTRTFQTFMTHWFTAVRTRIFIFIIFSQPLFQGNWNILVTQCDYVIAYKICSRIRIIYHPRFMFYMRLYHKVTLSWLFDLSYFVHINGWL